MTKNALNITISAVDKATETVQRINRSFSKLTQPVDKLRTSIGGFSKEAGLSNLQRSFGRVGREAKSVAGSISRIVAPLTTVMGAASIAGVVASSASWAKYGTELAHTAENIGLTTGQLQRLQATAKLSGLSADSMTSSMASLGTTMQDVMYGRNYQALAVMNQLGIQLHTTANGAVDTERAFNDLGGAIARFNDKPQAQQKIAGMFGIDSMLPLLRKGKEGLADYKKEVIALGLVMSEDQIHRAEKFGSSLFRLKAVGENLKNTIGDKLTPVLGPLIDSLTKWIAVNKDLIATEITEFVKGLAAVIRSIDWLGVVEGLKSIGRCIKWVVDLVGGWKVATIGLVALLNLSLLKSVISLAGAIFTVGRVMGSLALVVLPILAKGFLALGAAIMATPIGWVALGIAGIISAGYLLYKFWGKFSDWFCSSWFGMGESADKGADKINNAGKKIKPTGANGVAVGSSRIPSAGGAAVGSPYAPNPISSGQDAGTSMAMASQGTLSGGAASSEVELKVTFENAPQGMKANIRSSGNVNAGSPKINYSMPTAVTP